MYDYIPMLLNVGPSLFIKGVRKNPSKVIVVVISTDEPNEHDIF